MPKEYISSQSCACCSSTLNKSQKKLVREVSSSGMMNKINNFLNKKIVKIGDLICNSCKCKIYRTSKKLSTQNSQIESMIFSACIQISNIRVGRLYTLRLEILFYRVKAIMKIHFKTMIYIYIYP